MVDYSTLNDTQAMCGRYALGLGDEALLDAIEERYPDIYRRLRRRGGGGEDGDEEGGEGRGRGRGGGGGGGGGRGGARDRVQRLRGGDVRWNRPQDFRPSFNLAPKQRAPVIIRDGDEGLAMIETMQWGLIPHWTKHPPTGPLNTINARSEALIDPSAGGMWNALKGTHRCIIPAQGYYEWQKKGTTKIAHFTRLHSPPSSSSADLKPSSSDTKPPSPSDPEIIFFAGLWDTVTYLSPVASKFQPNPDDPTDTREPYPTGNPIPLSTFTILTTIPAKDIGWLHDRMPVALTNEEDIVRWLDLGVAKGWEEGKGGTGELLKSTSGLDCYPVPPEVGKIGHSSPTFIQPVSERADGIKSFFQKQQPSPAKPKAGKPEHGSRVTKDEAEGIESKVEPWDLEKGLGDDSNAPNPGNGAGGKVKKEDSGEREDRVKENEEVKEEEDDPVLTSPSEEDRKDVKSESGGGGKRKRNEEATASQASQGSTKVQPSASPVEKRGGRQTKVIRRASPPKSREQPSITTFFKSPGKKGK